MTAAAQDIAVPRGSLLRKRGKVWQPLHSAALLTRATVLFMA